MPKPTKGPRIGGSPSHQRIIMANLATQLFQHGKITTTLTRAKRLQPLADHLITKAKRGDLHAIRTVGKTVTDKGVLDQLFKQIGPSMEGREGGYTRITKIGARQGDAAPMAIIEIVTEEVKPKKDASKKDSAKKATTKAKAEEVDEDLDEDQDEDQDDVEEFDDDAEAEDADDLDDDEAEDEADDDAEDADADDDEADDSEEDAQDDKA